MLVLSRRKNQKILFPNLGISVQIIDSRSGSVRLGVEAPPEVRIIRDELKDLEPSTEDLLTYNDLKGANQSIPNCQNSEQFRCHLDAANLAIHLARNQLRQGLDENADDAMAQALASLQALEQSSRGGQPMFAQESSGEYESSVAVHEPAAGYQISSPTNEQLNIVLTGMPPSLNRAKCCESLSQRLQASHRLQPPFTNIECDYSDRELIERVRSGPSLDLVLFFSPLPFDTESLRICGVPGLQPICMPLELEGLQATAWASHRVDLQKLVL